MEGTSRLYDTVIKILRQHENWLDLRHLYTLAWMIAGLIQSSTVSLTARICLFIEKFFVGALCQKPRSICSKYPAAVRSMAQ
jgi:hypothetical protein